MENTKKHKIKEESWKQTNFNEWESPDKKFGITIKKITWGSCSWIIRFFIKEKKQDYNFGKKIIG